MLGNVELLKLDFGVFMLHLVLAATFVVFPLLLAETLAVAEAEHWRTYLPVFALSVVPLVPMILVAEKWRRPRAMFLGAIALLILAEAGLALGSGYAGAFAALVAFFAAFNFLEAMLPTQVSRIAPADMKGTAMGLFSSAQFLGAFAGGLVGGALLARGDYGDTFAALALILCAWFAVGATMRPPRQLASRIVSLQDLGDAEVERFVEQAAALDGVEEVAVYAEDRVAYLKVEKRFDDSALRALTAR